MDVSENSGTPKSSILIGFSIKHHPFWGALFLETPKSQGAEVTQIIDVLAFVANYFEDL